MKKFDPKMIPVTIAALLFSVGLMAQETSVTVKVEKDGKVVKDTTYIFEDEKQAEHALKMMDIICSDDEHMMKVHTSMAEHHGEHVKVMKYKVDGDEAHGKHVVVVKSGDGETFDILIDEDCEHEHGDKKIVTKEVTVIVSGDDDGEWTVAETELVESDEDEDVEVIVIKKKEEKKKSKKQ